MCCIYDIHCERNGREVNYCPCTVCCFSFTHTTFFLYACERSYIFSWCGKQATFLGERWFFFFFHRWIHRKQSVFQIECLPWNGFFVIIARQNLLTNRKKHCKYHSLAGHDYTSFVMWTVSCKVGLQLFTNDFGNFSRLSNEVFNRQFLPKRMRSNNGAEKNDYSSWSFFFRWKKLSARFALFPREW